MPEPPDQDPAERTPLEPDTERGEIIPPVAEGAGKPLGSPDRGALLHWLEQNHRDAQANRAQARELARALEQVRDAHEYVGRTLRDERGRSRRLTVALLLAPAIAALAVWGIWDRLDASRDEFSERMSEIAKGQDELRRAQDTLQFGAAARAQEARADALEGELERARADLEGARARAAARAATWAGQDAALEQKIARLENENGETAGLRAQLEALRSRSGAESARATALEREIRRLERELGAMAVTGAARAPSPGAPAPDAGAAAAGTAAAASLPAPASPPETALPEAPAVDTSTVDAPDPAAGAMRRPEDLARIRDELNRLLALASDPVTYRIDAIGGVRGDTLLDVRLSGLDDEGRTVRTLEAGSATVRVRVQQGDVLIVLRDGHLLLGGRKAPFFDGRYAIIVGGDSEAWRISGLTCVMFE